ncbi:hypothetical protein MAR_026014, partial [Mya arenaria]
MSKILNNSVDITTGRKSSTTKRDKPRDPKGSDVRTASTVPVTLPYNQCKKHNGEPEEMFCLEHSCMVCIVCRRMYHGKCQEILRIGEASINFTKGSAPQKCHKQMRELFGKCQAVAREREWDLNDLERKRNDVINAVQHEKQKVLAKVEKLVERVMGDIERRYTIERTEISNHLLSLKEMAQELDTKVKLIETKRKVDSDLEMFVAVQNAMDGHKKTTSALMKIHNEAHKVFLKFEVSKAVDAAMKSLSSLGELNLNTMQYAVIPKLYQSEEPKLQLTPLKTKKPDEFKIRKHVDDRRLTPAGEIFSRDREDVKTCWITGMCVLKDSTIIVADNNNNRIKVIDRRDNVVNSVLLATPPFDISLLNQVEAAFTLPDKKQVQLIRIVGRSDIKYGETLQLDFDCNGITVLKGNIILTSIAEKCVRLINKKGIVLWTAVTDDLGEPLFEWPWYVTTNEEVEKVYVSDRRKNTVTTLDKTGTVLDVRDVSGKGPRGCAVDGVGNMFICHYMTDEIEIISLKFPRDRRTILAKVDAIKHPQSLAYDEHKGLLLLSANNSDYIN